MLSITSSTSPITRQGNTPTGEAAPDSYIAHAAINVTSRQEKPALFANTMVFKGFSETIDMILSYLPTLNDHAALFFALPPDLAQDVIRHYGIRNRNSDQLQNIWNNEVIGNNLETTRFLILSAQRMGCTINVNAFNEAGSNALTKAAEEGRMDVVRELLNTTAIEIDAPKKDSSDTALISAARSGHVEVVTLLLEKGANVTPDIFISIVGIGNNKIVTLLLDSRDIDINLPEKNSGDTALISAIRSGHMDVVTLLRNRGARANLVNRHNQTALMIATKTGNHNIMAVLLASAGIILDTQEINSGDTALISTARSGNTKIAMLLLEKGADVNLINRDHKTALMIAADAGNDNIAALLLSTTDIDFNIKRSICGSTPLMLAARLGKLQILRLLLKKGADVDLTNLAGETALMIAVKAGQKNTVKLLLSAADVALDTKDYLGKTALMCAIEMRHVEMVRLLLRKGANASRTIHPLSIALMIPERTGNSNIVRELLTSSLMTLDLKKNASGKTRWISEAERSREEIVDMLRRKGIYFNLSNLQNERALLIATKAGNHDRVAELLTSASIALDCQETCSGDTALILATKLNHPGIVELLLTKKADVNLTDCNDETALMIAAKAGNSNIAALLLTSARIDLDTRQEYSGDTALIYATKWRRKEIIQLLLKKGANVNHPNYSNETALMIAIKADHQDIVKLLLNSADIDLDCQEKYSGDTALISATRSDQTTIIDWLVEKHANINLTNCHNETALLIASRAGFLNSVKLLLTAAKIDLDAQENKYGNTALIFAATSGNEDVVQLLLEEGADSNLKNHENRTALMAAAIAGHPNIVELLRKHDSIATGTPSKIRKYNTAS
jgi:ankyrin repeat protein